MLITLAPFQTMARDQVSGLWAATLKCRVWSWPACETRWGQSNLFAYHQLMWCRVTLTTFIKLYNVMTCIELHKLCSWDKSMSCLADVMTLGRTHRCIFMVATAPIKVVLRTRPSVVASSTRPNPKGTWWLHCPIKHAWLMSTLRPS